MWSFWPHEGRSFVCLLRGEEEADSNRTKCSFHCVALFMIRPSLVPRPLFFRGGRELPGFPLLCFSLRIRTRIPTSFPGQWCQLRCSSTWCLSKVQLLIKSPGGNRLYNLDGAVLLFGLLRSAWLVGEGASWSADKSPVAMRQAATMQFLL